MSIATTAVASRKDLRTKELILSLVASGNYANSGTTGDVVNLNSILNPNFLGDAQVGYPAIITEYEVIDSPPGYLGVLVKGATPATWGLRVYQTGAAVSGPFAELANGAYPGAVTGSSFTIRLKSGKTKF